jgi:hypothetical protein
MSTPTPRATAAKAAAPALTAAHPGDQAGFETVRAKVVELIPAYHLVHLETADGRGLVLTAKTTGIDLVNLRVGQTIECKVTLVQPRVVAAHTVA